jgi:hypothetical protein
MSTNNGRPAVQVLQTTLSLRWRSSSPHINNPHILLGVVEWRKWGLASYCVPKFILCRVERGEVLRAGGVPGLSGVLGVAWARKLCQNPFGFDKVFRALVRSSAGALREFYEFWQRVDYRVPLVYREYPWHYLGVDDLPIIVSHTFASLMLFVHSLPYSRIGVCLVIHMVPCLRINRVQRDSVWRLLLNPLKVNCFDQAEDPR